jgi:hypothetical protein
MPPAPSGTFLKRGRNMETVILVAFSIALISLALFSKADVFMTAESDGYFHYLGAFFMYDAARWWFTNPTLSFDAIKSYVIDYQTHYKFFGGISYYQPFQSLFVAFLALFAGKNAMTFYLATALETILTAIFAYRLYKLLYRKNRGFEYLVLLFVAFSPAVFSLAASYSLEPAVMLFSTMTIFYFIRFLRLGGRRDLYLTAASLGLGMLAKTPFMIILPMLLISLVLERRFGLLLRDRKALLISVAIFILVISPWLAMEGAFAQLGISKLGERAESAMFNLSPDIPIRLYNVEKTVWAVFGSFLLIPFFLYKLLRSRLEKGELTLLVVIIFWPLYFNLLSNAFASTAEYIQPRYLTSAVPLAAILSVRGLQLFIERYRKSWAPLVIGFILFTMVLGSFAFTMHQKEYLSSTDALSPVIYISDNTDKPTTIVASLSRMFAAALAQIDDRNLYIVRAPFQSENGTAELEVMLDNSDYMRRPNQPEFERFNMTHPPVGWVLVPERFDGEETGYLLKNFMDSRSDFELVRIFDGKWPVNRVFVYKRVYFK